tara:strand:+ start:719 stop:1276 length:558 start_codon:yes stop_codon:yes gene_type:complete
MEETFINNITNNLQGRSIFLIGMMGCGKSSTGNILAQMLQYKYIDLDLLIEKVAKKSISNIFSDDGEKFFRDYETRCLNEIIKIPSIVISTGGGVVTTAKNWGFLRQGIVVWIDIDKNAAIERLKEDSFNRPLLKNENIEKKYTEIFECRKNFYAQADLQVKVVKENITEVAEKIMFEIHKKLPS